MSNIGSTHQTRKARKTMISFAGFSCLPLFVMESTSWSWNLFALGKHIDVAHLNHDGGLSLQYVVGRFFAAVL